MIVMRKAAFRTLTPLVLVAAAACGAEQRPAIDAELVAPEAREAKITLTPALEVSDVEQTLLDRILIEDIQLNLADVRLLGVDPRIPVGGLPLLEEARIVESSPARAGVELPFPNLFVDDPSLAVYVRIDKSAALDDAAVVVRARLYEDVVRGGVGTLVAATKAATDPDGDPADDPDGIVGATDPDGDPALPTNCDEATDPDGDPARTRCKRDHIVRRGRLQPFVMVEFRDDHAADLVATISSADTTDVVVGIPAARWLTPEVLAQLEAAFDAPSQGTRATDRPSTEPHATIVVETAAPVEAGPGQVDAPAGAYSLSDAENLERQTVRR